MALQEYKCPNCSGAIKFDSALQKMKCPFCDTEFEMEALKALDEDLKKTEEPDELTWDIKAGTEWKEGEENSLISYSCKSCGGEIVGDKNMAATSCDFCGNPVVVKGQFSGMLRPDYVIPFKLDKKAALAGLAKHLEKKFFLPRIFKKENHINEIKGVYVPFWLFDADAAADINFSATSVKRWSSGNYDYTETSYYSVFRSGSVNFDHIPVDGSEKIPDALMESIEPYSFSDAVDFQTAYLSGYLADKYDVTAEQSIDRANVRVKRSIEEVLTSSVTGYSSVKLEKSSVHISNGKAKYALYPVWLLNTIWRNKKYTFAMNGQTGKFVGDLPIDNVAVWRSRFFITAIVAIISNLLLQLIIYLS